MRWVLALSVLSGCDYVLGLERKPSADFPLESETHDEDGDGRVDRNDLCPHIKDEPQVDKDGDGIGDVCDPRPDSDDDRYFFAFDVIPPDTLMVREGITKAGNDNDSFLVGLDTSDHSAIVLPMIDAKVADIEFTGNVAAARDPITSYDEVRLLAVHRVFTDDEKMRGDACIVGTDTTMNVPPDFIQLFQDHDGLYEDEQRFNGEIKQLVATVTYARTPDEMRCTVVRNGMTFAATHVNAAPRDMVSGKVAIETHDMAVRLEYLFVVIPRP
jgi:hypothetical protein